MSVTSRSAQGCLAHTDLLHTHLASARTRLHSPLLTITQLSACQLKTFATFSKMCLSTDAQVAKEEEDTCCPDHHLHVVLQHGSSPQIPGFGQTTFHYPFLSWQKRKKILVVSVTIVCVLLQRGYSPGLGLLFLEGLHSLLSCFVCLCLLLCLLHRCSVVYLGFCKLDMG